VSLHRGYLPDGKDRQHPVRDPYDVLDNGLHATVWINPNIPTWYALTRTRMVPPATVIPEEPDNG
jgi:hypothetical protein